MLLSTLNKYVFVKHLLAVLANENHENKIPEEKQEGKK